MISIIISAHNEEKNIKKVLVDLFKQLKNLDEEKEIILGLSDCTDLTGKFAQQVARKYGKRILLIKTPRGKVNSQSISLKKVSKRSWGIIFLDSDIRLSKNAIKNIVLDARRYKNVQLFYSTEIPINRPGVFYNIINVRTLNPEYVIAKKDVAIFHPYIKNKRKKIFATGGMYLVRKGVYIVDKTVAGDDTYLTHSVYYRFGPGAIKQTENAIIYYQPVYTFSSWISKWKRIWGDIGSLYRLYPEFTYLKDYMDLKVDFIRLFREQKIKLIIYFSIERSWNKFGKFIFTHFLLNNSIKWDQLKETKEVNF